MVVLTTSRHTPSTACVHVSDAGCGIAEANREQVFDAFYTTSPTGMGMGLAISRSIIESHGGTIWVTPNADGGVTFHFTLPLPARDAHGR